MYACNSQSSRQPGSQLKVQTSVMPRWLNLSKVRLRNIVPIAFNFGGRSCGACKLEVNKMRVQIHVHGGLRIQTWPWLKLGSTTTASFRHPSIIFHR
jgi:hypothetical protein